jgi:predicted nuclease with TOPRIM domain
MDVEAEIRDLKRRLGELEGGFDDVAHRVEGMHRDLLALQAQSNRRFDRLDRRLERVDGWLERVDGRMGRVEAEVRQVHEELPSVVGDAMREVLGGQKR